MKLLGCIWSSQDVQHEALSLSLSLSVILQRLSSTELERSELCDHHYSDSSNPNKRTQIDVLPSCSSKGGGGGDLTGHKDSRQAPWFINLYKTEKKS
jgi:hypothetical protein